MQFPKNSGVKMITLRYPEKEDAEFFFQTLSEGNFPHYQATIPASLEAEEEWIERRKIKREKGLEYNYLILWNGEKAGGCELRINQNFKHIAEIGYFINRKFWGQGIATEVVKALENLAFNELNIKRIEIRMDPANKASEKVAVKNNYTKEALLQKAVCFEDKYYDNLLYVKLHP
jgi:ribosomal-protein-alanine N-acetyltransferase